MKSALVCLQACLLLALAIPSGPAQAANPGVESWNSEMRVARDGTATITEELEVNIPKNFAPKIFRHDLPFRPGPPNSFRAAIRYTALRGYINSKSVELAISTKGEISTILLGSGDETFSGTAHLIFQFEARGLLYSSQDSDLLLWYAARPWPGGVRTFTFRFFPPPFHELSKLQFQQIELIDGKQIISLPHITVGENSAAVSGVPKVGKEASLILVGLQKGFVHPN